MSSIEILFAEVGHRRLAPKKNEFLYNLFYTITPVMTGTCTVPYFFSFDRFNIASLYTRDHGDHSGETWRPWIETQCAHHGIPVVAQDDVLLISHPRLFGYVFNPISFWLVFEKKNYLKAVLCEVRNTFGDNHNYFLAHSDARPILPSDVFTATKGLYVSPFNQIENGRYTFSFDVTPNSFATSIDYFENGGRILEVFMHGRRKPLTTLELLGAIVMYPLMTIGIMYRIHKQALRLYLMGVKNTLTTRPGPTAGKTTFGND